MHNVPELTQDFCNTIFKQYGLFRSLQNPAQAFMKGKDVLYTRVTTCLICKAITECILCVPTREDTIISHVCFNCKHDLDMWGINPEEVDYCRLTKDSTIKHFKLNSQKFILT